MTWGQGMASSHAGQSTRLLCPDLYVPIFRDEKGFD